MKNVFAFLAFVIASGTLFAGPEKKTYEQAIKGNPADGVVVFLYGPDWEKQGSQLLKTLWKHAKVRSACGNAPMVAIPIYQRPNEKEKAEAAEKRKGFTLSKSVRSYPAIVLQTYAGTDYYTIYGDEIYQSPEKVAELMKSKFELYKIQRKFLQQAEKAKDQKKAELYAQAVNVEGLLAPKDAIRIIKAGDPNLENPACKRAAFDVYKLVTESTYRDKDNPGKKIFTVPDALAKLKELTAGDTYTPVQKQEIYAACTGFLRREGYDREKLKALYTEMIALDSDSMWASFAKESIRLYCKK